jgi:disulfide bond formation protein DsbB
MNKLLTFANPRVAFALLGVGSIALVLVAIALTTLLHLEPCPLCIFQRVLYLALGGLLVCAAAWPRSSLWAGALALITSAGGVATAGYQTWMQAFPMRFMECSIGVPTTPIEKLVDWLGQIWPWMFYAWGECTSREWELLGLSLANWSAVVFLAFTFSIGVLLHRRLRAKVP